LKAGLGAVGEKGSPPEAANTGWAKLPPMKLFGGLPWLSPLMPGGFWSVATTDAEASAHSEFDKGWMVAEAGPATAIIAAITNATVTIKTMRFIGATSLLGLSASTAL
jgi:hypothetical protein